MGLVSSDLALVALGVASEAVMVMADRSADSTLGLLSFPWHRFIGVADTMAEASIAATVAVGVAAVGKYPVFLTQYF